jgi:hypothetical protein
MPAHWQASTRPSMPGKLRIQYHNQLRAFAGELDLADTSHFTIAYQFDAKPGIIDGYLMPDGRVQLKPREGYRGGKSLVSRGNEIVQAWHASEFSSSTCWTMRIIGMSSNPARVKINQRVVASLTCNRSRSRANSRVSHSRERSDGPQNSTSHFSTSTCGQIRPPEAKKSRHPHKASDGGRSS